MNKESLKYVKDKVLEILENAEINDDDKTELMINLYYFLDPQKYDDNINVLIKTNKKQY